MADMMAVMNNGKIVEFGPSENIYKNPHEAYTRRLINATPKDDIELIRKRVAERCCRQVVAPSPAIRTVRSPLLNFLAMSDEPHVSDRDDLLPLAILSLLVGVAAGLVGALFQVCLNKANDFRNEFVNWSQSIPIIGAMLVVMLCATATGIAAWLVRRFAPRASGSGIPHTEAVLDATVPPAPFSLIPVKLVGGVLAIGSGLALGREGPSVQMGASLGHLIGRIARRPWGDCRVLIAAGAGAGLATAFNAPIAGAVFVLEELVRRFETQIAIAALGASATAMAVARIFLGDVPEFHVPPIPYPGALANGLFLVLGIVAGVLAVAYNRAILAALGMIDGFKHRPIEIRAAVIGGIVGLIAWFAPDLVGGGETLAQQTLDGRSSSPPLSPLFSAAVYSRSGILRNRNSGRTVRAAPSARHPNRPAILRPQQRRIPAICKHRPKPSPSSAWPRFSPGCPAARYRHCVDHRNDGQFHNATAHALGRCRRASTRPSAAPSARCSA